MTLFPDKVISKFSEGIKSLRNHFIPANMYITRNTVSVATENAFCGGLVIINKHKLLKMEFGSHRDFMNAANVTKASVLSYIFVVHEFLYI